MSKKSMVSAIPDDYVECRDFQHYWRPYDGKIDRRNRHIQRVLRCGRCGTLRFDKMSLRGAILSTHYQYPDGYVIKGMGRMTADLRAAVRLRNLNDYLDQEAPKLAVVK